MGTKAVAKKPTKSMKRIEITKQGDTYAYGRPGGETWTEGYSTPYNAKRGATRRFKDFIAKGGFLIFLIRY